MRTLEDRLTALETLVTAAPPALSVDTLRERVKLGDAAKAELSRTLSPWAAKESGEYATLYREAMSGTTEVSLNRFGVLTVRRQFGLELRWEVGTQDRSEMIRRADLLLVVAEYRLESTPAPA